jgi:hypothetical protein
MKQAIYERFLRNTESKVIDKMNGTRKPATYNLIIKSRKV